MYTDEISERSGGVQEGKGGDDAESDSDGGIARRTESAAAAAAAAATTTTTTTSRGPPTQPSQQWQPEQSQQQQQRRRFVTPADVVKTKIANSMTRRIGDKEFTNDSGSVDSFDEAVSFDQENEGAGEHNRGCLHRLLNMNSKKKCKKRKRNTKKNEKNSSHTSPSRNRL